MSFDYGVRLGGGFELSLSLLDSVGAPLGRDVCVLARWDLGMGPWGGWGERVSVPTLSWGDLYICWVTMGVGTVGNYGVVLEYFNSTSGLGVTIFTGRGLYKFGLAIVVVTRQRTIHANVIGVGRVTRVSFKGRAIGHGFVIVFTGEAHGIVFVITKFIFFTWGDGVVVYTMRYQTRGVCYTDICTSVFLINIFFVSDHDGGHAMKSRRGSTRFNMGYGVTRSHKGGGLIGRLVRALTCHRGVIELLVKDMEGTSTTQGVCRFGVGIGLVFGLGHGLRGGFNGHEVVFIYGHV